MRKQAGPSAREFATVDDVKKFLNRPEHGIIGRWRVESLSLSLSLPPSLPPFFFPLPLSPHLYLSPSFLHYNTN